MKLSYLFLPKLFQTCIKKCILGYSTSVLNLKDQNQKLCYDIHIIYKLFASYVMTFRKSRCVYILSKLWWHSLGCTEKSYTAMHVATNTSALKGKEESEHGPRKEYSLGGISSASVLFLSRSRFLSLPPPTLATTETRSLRIKHL